MSDDADNHTLRLLRQIQRDIAKIDLKLTDLTDSMRRMEGDIGALRGREGADRHDLDLMAGRWRDLEVRVRALEEPPIN